MAYTIDEHGKLVPVTGNVPNNVIQREFTLAQSMSGASAGEKVMMAVTPSDTSQSTELETYLGGFRQDGYIQDIMARIVPVQKETFKRRDFSAVNTFAPVEDRVGRSGAINQIEHASAVVEDKTEEHALAAFIPYASENDAVGTYNVRGAHSKMIRDKLTLNAEIALSDFITTLTNWNASNRTTITTNYRWSTGTTKDPLADIRARLHASWAPVDAIVMNLEVSEYFLKDSTVQNLANFHLGTAGAKERLMVESGIRGVQSFELPTLPRFYVVEAKKYVSGSMVDILADDVVLLSSPAELAGGDTMASYLRFRYQGRSGTGFTVNEYTPYGRGLNGGTMLEVGYSEARRQPSNRVGGLIKSVLTGT